MINSFTGKYRFLSNFWPARVTYEGIEYPTTEHAYQAAKTLDVLDRIIISHLTTPGQAKRAGKDIKLREDWEHVKVGIMRELLQQKFSRHTDLAHLLVDTGDEELVEGNTWGDVFWGVCRGKGQNVLGHLLMEVRKDLKELWL